MSEREPPDWALPSWDSIPAEPEEGSGRLRPVGPGPAAPGTFGVRILGVSEVTRSIRGAVRSDPRLADLWVEGEIGRVTISSAGHAYFALKDERNQLQCVWFRDDRLRSAFEAQAGRASWPTAGSTCSNHRARSSSMSSRSSRPDSATSPCASRR